MSGTSFGLPNESGNSIPGCPQGREHADRRACLPQVQRPRRPECRREGPGRAGGPPGCRRTRSARGDGIRCVAGRRLGQTGGEGARQRGGLRRGRRVERAITVGPGRSELDLYDRGAVSSLSPFGCPQGPFNTVRTQSSCLRQRLAGPAPCPRAQVEQTPVRSAFTSATPW